LGQEAGPGVTAVHSSRGCAFGDFDNDGDVDIMIVNLNEPPSLLRNDLKGTHHWLKVKLIGTKSNRSAIGARVLARYGKKIQAQEVLSQSSFYSVNDSRLHFGLGSEMIVDLEIRWPSGLQEKLRGVVADRLIVVKEGAGIISGDVWPKHQGWQWLAAFLFKCPLMWKSESHGPFWAMARAPDWVFGLTVSVEAV
jgi:enediyne biosynthesis protein E4